MEPSRQPPSLADLQKPLEHFRAKTQRLRIHPLEVLLLCVVCAHLIFLPWALGSRALWQQLISLAFGVLELGLALVPRHYTEEFSGEGEFHLYSFPKLVRFPIFWTGLALLLYILVQALNPAWRYMSDQRGWWMQQIPHVSWLPNGTDVPFAIAGQWRALIVYASAWLLVCAIWIGFTRRRTLQYFFTVLVANGFALVVFGLAQRIAGNGLMFWFWKSPNGSFFSSFTYKNHAGAYFNLMLALCGGLAAWHYLRSLRRLEKSNPAGVFVFFAVCTAIGILISYARAGTIVMLIYLTLAIIALLVYQVINPQLLRRPVVMIVLVAGFAYLAHTGFEALDNGQAWDRLKQLGEKSDASIQQRWRATQASAAMLKDHWLLGTGAGSYRFLFTTYQIKFPDIFAPGGQRLYWEHAHNDFLEFPIELGLPGMALILFSFGYWVLAMFRSFFWENPLSLLVLLGCLLLVAHAWTDFIFENPAILVTWCALWPALLHWTEYEELNLRA